MDKFIVRTPRPLREEASPSPSVNCSTKRKRVEFSEDDIIHDPAKHKSMDSYDPNIRDQVRMAYLLKGPCQPRNHIFEEKFISDAWRSFKVTWFDTYVWLEYSTSEKTAYCYLFKKFNGSQSGGNAFISKGFENWKKTIYTFVDYVRATNSSHDEARRRCNNLQNQRQSVSYLLSKEDLASQDSYPVRWTLTLKSARYLLGQGLAFRAHDESENLDNKGNFRELVNWCEDINPELAKHLGSQAPERNQMLSSDIQKDMANSCASLTVSEIIKDMDDSFYALLVDEARYNSIEEQMVVVLRYVNKHGQVIERFIGIEHLSETSAKSLKRAIDSLFSQQKLSISRLRGQGCDGASNMSGEFNGLKSKILEENPSAFFVHSFAHQLQLAIVVVLEKNCMMVIFLTMPTSLSTSLELHVKDYAL